MRHATTEGSSPGGDFERALTPEGHAEAARVGRWLAASGMTPGAALCSAARRVEETWAEVVQAFEPVVPARFERAIYGASAAELLQILSEEDEAVDSLMLVAHNPSVSHLAFDLTQRADPDGRERLRRGFRPATVAVFDLAAPTFAELPRSGARLVELAAASELPE